MFCNYKYLQCMLIIVLVSWLSCCKVLIVINFVDLAQCQLLQKKYNTHYHNILNYTYMLQLVTLMYNHKW